MKLAVVSTLTGAGWGGCEELWAGAAIEGLQRGNSVHACVARWRPTPPRVLQLQQAGIDFSFRSVAGRAVRFPPLYRSLARLTRPYSALYAFKPQVVLISLGVTWDVSQFFDAGFARYLRDTATPYITLSQLNDDAGPPVELIRQRGKEFFTNAARAVFVSEHNRRAVIRQLAMDLPNSTVIYNPVNLKDPSVVTWPADSSTVHMACVARLESRHKGHDLLFAALAQSAWQQRNWRLHLYGDGINRRYLEELAALLGLTGRIEFMGHVSDVRAIWADNHLLLLPSRYEGCALAKEEAMLCGRPVVATDVGGASEWIDDGISGFIAPAATPHSIADALERAWNARDSWPQMGQRAHEAAALRLKTPPTTALLDLVLSAGAAHP